MTCHGSHRGGTVLDEPATRVRVLECCHGLSWDLLLDVGPLDPPHYNMERRHRLISPFHKSKPVFQTVTGLIVP